MMIILERYCFAKLLNPTETWASSTSGIYISYWLICEFFTEADISLLLQAIVDERLPFSISSERILPLTTLSTGDQTVCDRGLNAIWVFLYVWWSYLLLDLLDKLSETEFDSLFVFSHYLLPWNTLLYIQSQTNTSDQTLFTIFLPAKREHTDDPIAKINPGNVSVNYWYVETFIYAATFLSLEAQFACALHLV